jgi:membrane protein implicated in regulation of membrane protease activity
MDHLDRNTLLVLLGLVAIILEVLLGAPTGFDLLLLGVIFMIGGGMGILTANFIYALGLIIALSFLYIFFGRKAIRQKLNVTTRKTNTDNLISQTAVVTKAISPEKPGQIKVEGEIWRAEAEKAVAVGRKVEIESVSGVTLKVREK